MNLSGILKYGHQTVLNVVDGLPDKAWDQEGVCGVWSVKDVVAHLTSFEHMLVDVLNELLDGGPTPYLDEFRTSKQFNDDQVAKRKATSPAQVLTEYQDTHAKVMALAARIPPEQCRENGTLPWYGKEYSLDDFAVYSFYGHKREHSAQIALFKKRLG